MPPIDHKLVSLEGDVACLEKETLATTLPKKIQAKLLNQHWGRFDNWFNIIEGLEKGYGIRE